uniref:cysteine dioxygenase n=1 Tax=Oryza sativa subsp. japonica TaxID=39947 RepID=Q7XM51_ORYSJ|nr:OSJNBb0018J12.8 [Oryza sativa Japonica Group]
MGVHVFADRLAFAAADWCLCLHGWPIMPPLLGVYDFTAGLPPSPPTGVFAYMVDWIQIQICIKGIHGFKLISYAPGMDQSEHHHRLASTAADWCFRLHGWPIMPPLLGVYVFTDRLAFAAANWCFRLHGRPIMPPLLGVYVFTDRLAFAAADWCFRLHGWPIMPPLLGVYVFTDRLAFAAADWCFRLHGWPLCRRCWASTSSPTGRLVRRRLVLPPARLTYYAAVVGRLHLHRPAASTAADLAFAAADWCFRLHGWPIMPPLLGVYVFTDRLAFAAAYWCFRLHGWPLCRRCWASTSSPTGRLVRRRLVLPPARLTYYAAVVGRLHLHPPAASTAADWCFRLHGWPIMLPLLGVYVFTDRPPRQPPTGVSACTAGLLGRRCWASTSSPTGRRIRR